MYGLFCFSTNLRPVRGLALVSVHILLRLLQPIKQNFLSEINRTLPKILFSWTRACVRERMPIGQFSHEAVVTIKVTSTISASFFIDLLGVAAIGHYRNFVNKKTFNKKHTIIPIKNLHQRAS